jgi:inorganic pyrophosphatase
MNLYDIKTHAKSPRVVNAIIEIPKHTSAKYEYDPDTNLFKLDRCLRSAMVYPANYGFVPDTHAQDGDALDILIYCSTSIERGTLVECKVLGCLDMTDAGEKDYKVLAVPVGHHKKYDELDHINEDWLKITTNFFMHYKDLDYKRVTVDGWLCREITYDIIDSCAHMNK